MLLTGRTLLDLLSHLNTRRRLAGSSTAVVSDSSRCSSAAIFSRSSVELPQCCASAFRLQARFAISLQHDMKRRKAISIVIASCLIVQLMREILFSAPGARDNARFHPNKVMIWDDQRRKDIGELSFRHEVRPLATVCHNASLTSYASETGSALCWCTH